MTPGKIFLALILLAAPAVARAESFPRFDAASLDFFEKKIRPLLIDNCFTCHSADTNSHGGLRVDDRNGLLFGGDSGAAVVPGHPEESLLIRAVSYADEDLQMPPKKRLSAQQVADLTKWVQDGAAWPDVRVAVDLNKPNPEYDQLRQSHWAWQPLQNVKPPAVRDRGWVYNEIDAFVLARLEEKGLSPLRDANKLALLRRVTFDLTGLPPAAGEIDAFLGDGSPDALEKVVDRLLASAAFGERWGRHWLDVARYGESTGSSRNLPYPQAWRYRDYVIESFNRDKPYDQFIREQIAGDLLPAGSPGQRDEQQIATGFLALGVKDVNQRFKVRFLMDNVDEQIDTVSRCVLGLTASCARCHDHKFDPIPRADYYALAGIFLSTDLCAGVRNLMGGGGFDYCDTRMVLHLDTAAPVAPPNPQTAKKIEDLGKALAKARTELEALRGKPDGNELGTDGGTKRSAARGKVKRAENDLLALTDPAVATGHAALGVREAKIIGDTAIRIRGEAEKLGPTVPRGFLSVVPIPNQPSIDSAHSGRLELAQWLTSDKNPLTPRVMANRVWQHLFGRGLVGSVDNFGITGDTPTHPELLDYLARRFVRDGWSIKKLIRTLVLSRAYRLSSDATPANLLVDPANRFVWRHSPRRLDAEELRDTTLAAAGDLDRARPPAAVVSSLKVVEMTNDGAEAKRIAEAGLASRNRSVYLPMLRGLVPRPLQVFDFAEQGMVTGSRNRTTVAPQALYLLNDPFVRRASLDMADRLLAHGEWDDTQRINWAYRLTLARTATAPEIDRALHYLTDYESEAAGLQAATPSEKDSIQPANPRAAAWASFCQALFGSAEFRYLQ